MSKSLPSVQGDSFILRRNSQETTTSQKFALQVQNDSQDSGMFSRDVSNNDNLMSYSPRFQGYFYLKNLDNVP